jgi:hypothetical protein
VSVLQKINRIGRCISNGDFRSWRAADVGLDLVNQLPGVGCIFCRRMEDIANKKKYRLKKYEK